MRILSDSAVAAGVRRIEALTGEAARKHLDEQDRRLKAAAATLRISPADVPARVEVLLEERKKLEKDPARPQHILTEPWLGYRFQLPIVASEKTPRRKP